MFTGSKGRDPAVHLQFLNGGTTFDCGRWSCRGSYACCGSQVRIDGPKLIRRVVTNPSFGLVPHMPLVSLGGSWCFVLLRDAIVGIYLQLHRWRDGARTREIEVCLWLEKPRAIAPRVAPRLALGDTTLKRRICIAFWRSAFESCNVLSARRLKRWCDQLARWNECTLDRYPRTSRILVIR